MRREIIDGVNAKRYIAYTMPKPILFKNLTLSFPHKVCFEDFCARVPSGGRVALIGGNGSGKSTLLKALAGLDTPLEGEIMLPGGAAVGYVPQTVQDFEHLSGGQRFNKALSRALAARPDILLLDEPTNHLDMANRRALFQMLERFDGTLFVASHDEELLRRCAAQLWVLQYGHIDVFCGRYDDYLQKRASARAALENEKYALEREKKDAHKKLMQEQQRAAGSRRRGELSRAKSKWAPIVAGGKERQAQNTAGRKKSDLNARRQDISAGLKELFIPEEIIPSFALPAAASSAAPLFVSDGEAGYEENKPVLQGADFTLGPRAKAAVVGDNASGKTTFLRAVLGDGRVWRKGVWQTPGPEHTGYLDQHYANVPSSDETVWEFMLGQSALGAPDLRAHLNSFLFRKNEEVNAPLHTLSGGERARLSLAAIALKVPRLLILDEITNNLDLPAKKHVAQILSVYPGALLLVSHEPDFISRCGITDLYLLQGGRFKRQI